MSLFKNTTFSECIPKKNLLFWNTFRKRGKKKNLDFDSAQSDRKQTQSDSSLDSAQSDSKIRITSSNCYLNNLYITLKF